jgi:hypothetical protein
MKAGRGLDALIADKVLGLDVYRLTNGYFFRTTEKGYTLNLAPLKYYSTKIADAWEVVEKMEELGYMMWLEQEGIYQCMFFKGLDYQEKDYSVASSAPLTICLSALKTKEIDVESEDK